MTSSRGSASLPPANEAGCCSGACQVMADLMATIATVHPPRKDDKPRAEREGGRHCTHHRMLMRYGRRGAECMRAPARYSSGLYHCKTVSAERPLRSLWVAVPRATQKSEKRAAVAGCWLCGGLVSQNVVRFVTCARTRSAEPTGLAWGPCAVWRPRRPPGR